MSDLQLNSATTPPVQAPAQVQSPKPPKSQSDHTPVNETTTSRGPAVVLSGGLAKPTDRDGKSSSQGGGSQGSSPPAPTSTASTGQHINHVI